MVPGTPREHVRQGDPGEGVDDLFGLDSYLFFAVSSLQSDLLIRMRTGYREILKRMENRPE